MAGEKRRKRPSSGAKSEATDRILFILAPPRSFSWKFCAALGQHPELYALPEMHLFSARTVSEWWTACDAATFAMSHGVLRAIAQILFGEQTEDTIQSAGGWLRRRGHFTTAMLFEILAERVSPRILVDKSPSIVYSLDAMNLAYRMFPAAKFIHLVRHPRGHCESVFEAIHALASSGTISESHWLLSLAKYPYTLPSEMGASPDTDLNPQRGWYALNANICGFLKSVPKNQQIRIQAEEFISSPDTVVRQIARWARLRTDAAAIEATRHPARSPYAGFGPSNARFGTDAVYLDTPSLSSSYGPSSAPADPPLMDKGLPTLQPEVIDLARRLGYTEA